MRESISEKRGKVDDSLKARGLMGRVERFFESQPAQEILNTEFENNLQALREKVKDLPACYCLSVKMVYDAKCAEKEGYCDTVSTVFRFNLDDSVNKLAGFMPVEGVIATLADESQNEALWLESLRAACKDVSRCVMEDFCEKLLDIGMPASKTKTDMKVFVLTLTGEMVSEAVINHLWIQHVVLRGMTGIFR